METESPDEHTDTSARICLQENDLTENPILADDIQNDVLSASTANPQSRGHNSDSPENPSQTCQPVIDLQTNQDNKDSDSSQDDISEPICPRVNCPEKIVIKMFTF